DSDQRRVFAEAVSAEALGGEPEGLDEATEHGDLAGKDRRLRVLGQRQPVVGLEAESPQVERQGVRGLVEGPPARGEGLVEVAPHARSLAALARKDDGSRGSRHTAGARRAFMAASRKICPS